MGSNLVGGASVFSGRRTLLLPLSILVAIIFLVAVVIPSNRYPGPDSHANSNAAGAAPAGMRERLVTKTVTSYRDCPTDAPAGTPYGSSASLDQLSSVLMHANGSIVSAPHRSTDIKDAFSEYRGRTQVPLTSRDLHQPFEPLCHSLPELLDAMTNGGRIGQDAPYQPRGCDMRWYTTEEICTILDRFSYIWVVGDSLIRHTSTAFHIFLRADLYEGGWAKWHASDDLDCRGPAGFGNGGCLFAEAWSSSGVWDHEPSSMKCSKTSGQVEFVMANKYPLNDDTFTGTLDRIKSAPQDKPQAFILGQGLWNDLNEDDSHKWYNQFETAIKSVMSDAPALSKSPYIFMTPSAGGVGKPDKFQAFQSNIQLARFELNMGPWVRERGMWHLGTWNATIQNSSPDGTHSGMKADMLKAMMLLNWLDWVGKAIEKDGKAPVPRA